MRWDRNDVFLVAFTSAWSENKRGLHMAENPLESIIYQHVVYGTGTILTGYPDLRAAPIQPAELQAAVAHAKPLLQGHEYESSQSSDDDLQQIRRLYNATVIDGRFLDDLAIDPKSVAAKLGVELSDSAEAEIKGARKAVAGRFGPRFGFEGFEVANGKKIVAIAVVVVIAIRAQKTPYDVVIDSSGVIKV
jgi:hypothetical protein